MSGDRSGLFIEQDGFKDMRAFIEHLIRFEEAASEYYSALRVYSFKGDPDFV